MRNNLDKMEYSDFVEYLEKRGIAFTEITYVDDCLGFEEVIEVTPISKKLKVRIFSTDGGWQMFEGRNYFKEF